MIARSRTGCNIFAARPEILTIQDRLDILTDERFAHVSGQTKQFYVGK